MRFEHVLTSQVNTGFECDQIVSPTWIMELGICQIMDEHNETGRYDQLELRAGAANLEKLEASLAGAFQQLKVTRVHLSATRCHLQTSNT